MMAIFIRPYITFSDGFFGGAEKAPACFRVAISASLQPSTSFKISSVFSPSVGDRTIFAGDAEYETSAECAYLDLRLRNIDSLDIPSAGRPARPIGAPYAHVTVFSRTGGMVVPSCARLISLRTISHHPKRYPSR